MFALAGQVRVHGGVAYPVDPSGRKKSLIFPLAVPQVQIPIFAMSRGSRDKPFPPVVMPWDHATNLIAYPERPKSLAFRVFPGRSSREFGEDGRNQVGIAAIVVEISPACSTSGDSRMNLNPIGRASFR